MGILSFFSSPKGDVFHPLDVDNAFTKRLAEKASKQGLGAQYIQLEGSNVVQINVQDNTETIAEGDDFSDDAKIIKSIKDQVGAIQDQRPLNPDIQSLPEIIIDQKTKIVIPKYLRTTDLYIRELKGSESLPVLSLTEKMVKNLSGIDIKIKGIEEDVITQMYKRMNINGVETTLGEYILNPEMAQLQEIA